MTEHWPIRFTRNHPLVDTEAFSAFYERTHRQVYRYMMALCSGLESEAEEITSEAFTRAWRQRRKFRGDADQAVGWIIKIARNALIDLRRGERRRPDEVDIDDYEFAGHEDAETMFIAQDRLQDVLDALQDLPLTQREIIVLRHTMGWQVKQVARHLEMPENTVSVYYRRALKRLRAKLNDAGEV